MANCNELLRHSKALSAELVLRKEKVRKKRDRIWKSVTESQESDNIKQEVRCLETYVKKQDQEVDYIYDFLQSVIKLQRKTLTLLQSSQSGLQQVPRVDISFDDDDSSDPEIVERKSDVSGAGSYTHHNLITPDRPNNEEQSPEAKTKSVQHEAQVAKGDENAQTGYVKRSNINAESNRNVSASSTDSTANGGGGDGSNPSSSVYHAREETKASASATPSSSVTATASTKETAARETSTSDIERKEPASNLSGTDVNTEASYVPMELWERECKEAEAAAKSVYESDRVSDPDGRIGMYTVICLDTSSSMTGTRWKMAQEFLSKYFHHLKLEATEFERYDHVALVVFGSEIKVVSYYTREYTQIQEYCCCWTRTEEISRVLVCPSYHWPTGLEQGKYPLFLLAQLAIGLEQGKFPLFSVAQAINLLQDSNRGNFACFRLHTTVVPAGPSNLCAALVLCLGVIQGGFVPCKYGDAIFTSPRILLITDGYATSQHVIGGPDVFHGTEGLGAARHITQITARRDGTKMYPLFVEDWNQAFLKRLAVITEGMLLSADTTDDDTMHIKRFFRQHRNIILAGREVRDKFLFFLAPLPSIDATVEDQEDIRAIIRDHENARQMYLDEANFLLDVPDNMPPLGARVRRGPEWGQFNDNDKNGCGTVIGHRADGYVHVCWDNSNKGIYQYGKEGRYEVIIVEEPRTLDSDNYLITGCRVVRGPDWDDDANDIAVKEYDVGTVIRTHSYGVVLVVWPNGRVKNYAFGFGNMLEVKPYKCQSTSDSTNKIVVPVCKNRATSGNAPEQQQRTGSNAYANTSERQSVKEETVANTASGAANCIVDKEQTVERHVISKQRSRRNKNSVVLSAHNRSRCNSLDTAENIGSVNIGSAKGTWQYKIRDKSWKGFSVDVSNEIEDALVNNPSGTLSVDILGQQYQIIPSDLRMVHIATKTTSEIRRVNYSFDQIF